MRASGLSGKTDEEQVNTFIYIIGSQAEDILLSFGLTDGDSKKFLLVMEFDNYFVIRRNVIYERAMFNSRKQEEGEPVDTFITSLYALAEHCNFGALHDELIRDRIVVGKTVKQVITEPDNNAANFLGAVSANVTFNDAKNSSKRWSAEVAVNEMNSLLPVDQVFCGPSKNKLQTKGMFRGELVYLQERKFETIYVVNGLAQPLLSLLACEYLGLVRRINHVENQTKLQPTQEFAKLFSGLGTINEPYDIKLEDDAVPFAIHTPRRVPIPLLSNLKKQLDDMVLQGVIEPVDKPTDWCAPMVITSKKNGDIRVCVELTRLNKFVKRERHPMPSVEHTLGQLTGAKIFSKLDANSGFWQIKLTEESKLLTTFITPFGRFCYNRLPFGITSAPQHYQKRMSSIVRGLEGILCQMDDILVWGSSVNEHDKRLRLVLQLLQISGVTLNDAKCQFGVQRIKFLVHILDEDGVHTDGDRIIAIINME
ncbi:uncharacterized protein K02A2.6-like [Eupeodes corollae]|uniref:uncharacterized protein K02A2.6-like n=1 Tax=Eupeodes corollae TaxID=290404 RepID=UPI002493B9E0|nr:uncharacterized protein K02A2.6-like [Eupeodes corollae]